MLKVIDKNIPTFKQICNITSNLRDMFPDHMSGVTLDVQSYTHYPSSDPPAHGFYLHANGECWSMRTWEELLEGYHNLMGDPDA